MPKASDNPIESFDANPSLEELAAQQGKHAVTDVKILHGDFWPEDEPIEDFLAALDEWRDCTLSHSW